MSLRTFRSPGLWALLLLIGPPPLVAQRRLTLQEAFARADQHAFANRLAGADRDRQAAERDRTLRGVLPSLRFEAGWARTTDPLGAFGTRLRQRKVTPAAFDPDRLNDPASVANLGTSLVVEVPLLNPEAWLGRRAAASAMLAADASVRWTRSQVHLEVVRSYYGSVLAREQVAALEAGLVAAQSHVRSAEALHRQGLVTRSDVLLAEVKTGEVETRLISARRAERLALKRLALVLGAPEDSSFALPPDFSEFELIEPPDPPRRSGPRADVAAARFAATAARRDVARAGSLMLPSVNSFGRLDWNTPGTVFGGRSAWTVGVMARWSLFSGGGELAERNRARAEAARAETRAEAAAAQAGLELEERSSEVQVARATLAIAERALAQTVEAHRIITRKYEGGLATVTELFEAAALEIRTRVDRAAAVHDLLTGAAAWQVAMGYDLTDFPWLDRKTETP